jgi:KaiC/GvpD/RAD55 family RecA-like ATPase
VAGVDQLQHRCRPRRAAEVTFEENPEALLRLLAAAGISIARQVDEVEA